jgi:hypothetical protein
LKKDKQYADAMMETPSIAPKKGKKGDHVFSSNQGKIRQADQGKRHGPPAANGPRRADDAQRRRKMILAIKPTLCRSRLPVLRRPDALHIRLRSLGLPSFADISSSEYPSAALRIK